MKRGYTAVLRRWESIAWDYPTAPVEVVLALLWISWGVALLLNPDLMEGGRVYRVIRSIVHEWQLAAIFLCLGSLHLAGVESQSRVTRRIAAFGTSVTWVAWAIQCFFSAGMTVSFTQSVVMAMAALWMTWRWAGARPGKTPARE